MANLSDVFSTPLAGGEDSSIINGTSEHAKPAWNAADIPDEHVAELDPATRMVFCADPNSPGADRFRFMRMRLQELKAVSQVRSILITSPVPGDGKSTIVMNLATALAENGRRNVLVVEGDLHHPSLAQRLGVPLRRGLAECLEGGLDPRSMMRRLRPLDWFLLQAGKASGNPAELLHSSYLSAVLKHLSRWFDWIVIDTPPVMPLTDAVWLSRQADASLLVVRAGRTPRELVEKALESLGPNKVFGIILNSAEGLNRLYSKYNRYYGRK